MPSLVISVRFFGGRYHGLNTAGRAEWPPSPARLFQALVAGAARGANLCERDRHALECLEQLDPPLIATPTMREGHRFSHFMPNNDLDAVGGDPRRIGEIRTATKRFHPRIFERDTPLLYVWSFAQDMENAERARNIADRLYQLGRGVDMAWAVAEIVDVEEAEARLFAHHGAIYRPTVNGRGGRELACPLRGSLGSLIERYEKSRSRFRTMMEPALSREDPSRMKVAGQTFSQPPKPRFQSVTYNSPATLQLFDIRVSSPDASFFPWPQERAGALTIYVRDAAEKRLRENLPERRGEIERVLIGREATEADKAARVRIMPLPSIGHHHTERSIRRVLIEVPPNCPIDVGDLVWAFSEVVVNAGKIDTATGEILEEETRLVPAVEETMLTHYGVNDSQSYRHWKTVTPAALPECAARRRIDPRRLREEAKPGSERTREQHAAATAVFQALRHARIDARVSAIHVQREPFDAKGSRAEAFADGTRFAKERLWHVEIGFAEPVSGPLILGDGRYMGLGLMAPVRRVEGIHCFEIRDGLRDRTDATVLAHALRRAVMSRVQEEIGRQAKLPAFFSGHEQNGAPLRSGIHGHLAFAADLARNRLLILAPHLLEGRQSTHTERQYLTTLDASVADLRELRAGVGGRLRLVWSAVDVHEDSLFTAARSWESVTDYRPTRHGKRMTQKDALVADVRSEVLRRGIAKPKHIEVIDLCEGPRGGLAGRLRLHFTTAVRGPILIGRTRHAGGGLFSATARGSGV